MSAVISIQKNGSNASHVHVLLAHGAGAGLDHPFMSAMAEGLAAADIAVSRFNFPYMDRIKTEGKKRPPDRQPVLEACFADMIATVPENQKLILAGKSMGGRIASLAAAKACSDETDAIQRPDGWIALGYPFHAPGKPEKMRMDHFPQITCPGLICQGERDPFGNRKEILDLPLDGIETIFLPDGDHSFKPRKASGVAESDNFDTAINAMIDFIRRLD